MTHNSNQIADYGCLLSWVDYLHLFEHKQQMGTGGDELAYEFGVSNSFFYIEHALCTALTRGVANIWVHLGRSRHQHPKSE